MAHERRNGGAVGNTVGLQGTQVRSVVRKLQSSSASFHKNNSKTQLQSSLNQYVMLDSTQPLYERRAKMRSNSMHRSRFSASRAGDRGLDRFPHVSLKEARCMAARKRAPAGTYIET